MTKSRNYTWISLLVLMALAFALLFAFAVAPAQANAEPETHTHDDITFTAWTSTTSLPGSAGSYYLTADVTLSGTWTMPSGGVSICLNGYGIKATSGRAITVNGGTLNIYDCGDATHYFDVDGNGKAVNVNDVSGDKSFTGGYITGGNGQGGLSSTSTYWGEGGGILVWSGTFNMYGGTILGNSAGHGGGVEVVNATMNLYGGSIMYNTQGEGGAGINLRSQSDNTVTLNMYGGSVSYNKGTSIDQSYCYGNRYLNLYGGSISRNYGTGVWISNTTINGDPVIEENTGRGMLANNLSIQGKPVIRNNGAGDLYVGNNQKITIAGTLKIDAPISVTMAATDGGVFTTDWATYMSGDPADSFFAYNADFHVEEENGEAKLVEGRIIYVNNGQGTIKSFFTQKTDTIGSVKSTAATAFGVDAAGYKLVLEGVDLEEDGTIASYEIKGNSTLYLLPVSGQGLKTLTLVPSVESDATKNAQGSYTSIKQGDTITITYASTQNSGFSDAIFTTAFDEEYFHLTAFAVDTAYYYLLNDYGREVGGDYVPMTLAQHIADHNASLDAGEDPYTGRLSFFLTFKDSLFDDQCVTSAQFITVTYTVVKDVPAGSEIKFGFDMSLDGMFTNAAYDDDILLFIIDENGDMVDDEMVTITVKGLTEVEIVEDQNLVLSGSTVDTSGIALTWIQPDFDQTNPYIADGGEVTYTFYTKDGESYVPAEPNAIGDYYVKATLSETDHYIGYETDYVAITVKGTTSVAIVEDQSVVLPFGTDDIELTWTAPTGDPNPYVADGGSITYTFYTKDGESYVPVSGLPTVPGAYYVKATLSGSDHYVGTETDYVAITVKGTTEVSITEDQVLRFHNSSGSYVILVSDIEHTWEKPTPSSDYLSQTGADLSFIFYTESGGVYTPLMSGETPVVPHAVGSYYVKAFVAETEYYVGYETDYVAITVAPLLVDVPDLILYASDRTDGITPVQDGSVLAITADVTYGSTLTLKEIVDTVEGLYNLPATDGVIGDLRYDFATKSGNQFGECDNYFTVENLTVGEYWLVITPKDFTRTKFADPSVAEIRVCVTIVPAKVIAPTETTLTYTYSGEEQTYTFATTGDTALYTVTGNTRTDAGSQTVTVALTDAVNYEWEAGGVEDLSFTFTINKASVTEPTATTLTYTYTGEEQTYDFETDGDTAYFTVTNDKRTNAGEQTVTATLNDKDNYVWKTAGGVEDIVFTFTIAQKEITIATYIGGLTEYPLTYGDAAPAASAFTYTVSGIIASEEQAILDALDLVLAITAEDVDYELLCGVGEYVYTTTATDDIPANYTISSVSTAKIVVSPKALVPLVYYSGIAGKVTFSYSHEDLVGSSNDIEVVYDIDGVALPGYEYFATAADASKENAMVMTVTPSDPNYAAASLELALVHSATFTVTEAFAAAENMPDPQYIFHGQIVNQPAQPTFDRYVFASWKKEGILYFFSTPVTEDIVLVASWTQTVYDFRFRALNAGADYDTGTYYDLKWENGAFVLADSSETFSFTVGDDIPTVGTVGSFRLDHWVKAVKESGSYYYTDVTEFHPSGSVEMDEDSFYIAVMTLDLGRGDVNGDGSVSAEDIILMKKFLVGVKYETLTTPAAVWAKVGETAPASGYLYTFLWDANGDGYKDTRDVLTSRMALATGYGYEIVSDVTEDGVYYSNEIIVEVEYVNTFEALGAALALGKHVVLSGDIDLGTGSFETEGSIYIDLGGKTLTSDDFTVEAAGSVTLKSGVLGTVTAFTVTGSKINFVDVKDTSANDIIVVDEKNFELTAA